MNQPAHLARRSEPAARPEPRRDTEVPRHLRVVDRRERSPARRRRRARMILAAGAGAAVLVMFGVVYLHVVMAQRQIELDRMASQVTASARQYQAMRLRVAQLESPQQIISTAEGKLGMRQPGTVTYVSPPPGATPAPPAAVPAGGPAARRTGSGSATTAPAGDADWPRIKAELAEGP